jgi:hypothetical protein
VHIVEHDVKPAGKGAKIFVPADQMVDQAHFDALLNVAASKPRGPSWEGSAWSPQVPIPAEAALRYALLTPRLVAPHRTETTRPNLWNHSKQLRWSLSADSQSSTTAGRWLKR